MSDLLVIVPTRARPYSVARIVEAWQETNGYADADLMFVTDNDDPTAADYRDAYYARPAGTRWLAQPQWTPMVPKLNAAALIYAAEYFAVGFAGDDHLPRTKGWAGRYLETLREMGTGIVYGDDRFQGEKLPTQWAMTSDIVKALGRMVPAPVEHMYCDNSVLVLGKAAGCIRYLPDVVVEHMHPFAGKATVDAGYARVNTVEQYAADRVAFLRYSVEQFRTDVETVKALRGSSGAIRDPE